MRAALLGLGAIFVLAPIVADVCGIGAPGFGQLQTLTAVAGLLIATTGLFLGKRSISIKVAPLLGLLLLTVSVVLALILCEIASALIYKGLPSMQGTRNMAVYLGELDSQSALAERPHPYMLWENSPHYVGNTGIVQTNARGYRNSREYLERPGPSTLRILTLGGSTTYGYMLDGPDDAWPSQLETLLNKRASQHELQAYQNVEVINGGLNYATSAELLSHYVFRDRYLGAHVVVFHEGGNDAGPLVFHDYNPEYTHFRPGWDGKPHRLRRGELKLIRNSRIAKLFYALWLNDAPTELFCNKQSTSFELDEEYYVRNAKANSPDGFERNLQLLVRTVQSDGAVPILFPFIMTSDTTFKALGPDAATKAAFTRRARKGVQIAMGKLLSVIRTTAEHFKVPIVEVDPDTIPVEHWLDHCHLFKEGETVKARALADFIVKVISESDHK